MTGVRPTPAGESSEDPKEKPPKRAPSGRRRRASKAATKPRCAVEDAEDGKSAKNVPATGPAEGLESIPEPLPVDSLLHCLLKVTQKFGRPVSEDELRLICPIPDGGMTLETFCLAAARIGYKARSMAIDGAGIEGLPTPFVLLGEGPEPARVVLGRERAQLVVFDPRSEGSELLSPAQVLQISRRVVLLKPGDATAAAPQQAEGRWRALVINRVKRVVWELFLASLVINLVALAPPLFLMTVYNKVIGQSALSTLNVLALGMIAVYAFDFLLRAIRGYISSHTGARMDALIGSEVVHHLLHLPYRYYEATPTGMIGERLRQLDVVRQFFCGPMPITLVDLLFVGVFLLALFWINPLLAAIALAAMPVFLILSLVLHGHQKGLIEQNFLALAAKSSALAETMNNALTIKSLGLEGEVEKRWGDRLALSAWTSFKTGNVNNVVSVVSSVLQQVVGLAIIYLGALAVTAGDMSIGALIAASILANRALAPMRQVVSAWHQTQEVRAAFQRIEDILSEPMESRPGELAPLPPITGAVTFEKVRFSYGEDLEPVLNDLDLVIESDSIFGIIGPFGSGKSTLAKLIQGLYMPDSGRILIDGSDISKVSLAALRRQFGAVPQDIQLFAGTVRENIAMGTPLDEPERVVAAAKFVGAHDFIQKLPKGYNTVLGERGGGLSAGQRQLLCIARALMRNPRILLLDEATSALDEATEQRLMANLRRVSSGRTIIIISHRLAAMAIADKVALLIDGRIDCIGPPKEVIADAKTRMAEWASGSGS